jgi:hypothetical protein
VARSILQNYFSAITAATLQVCRGQVEAISRLLSNVDKSLNFLGGKKYWNFSLTRALLLLT